MASGLIILAIGSIKILGEKLNLMEIIAIIIMIAAVTFIGLSGLSIAITEENLLDPAFLIRLCTAAGVLTLIAIVCEVIQRKNAQMKGILLALISGLMLSLNNFWITPFIWSLVNMFTGSFNLGTLFLFLIASAILIVANVFGVIKMSQGFRHGRASYLAPIQNVPVQLTPSILYFLVFMMIPPSVISIVFFIIGIILIISSSFILGKRQAEIEQIS